MHDGHTTFKQMGADLGYVGSPAQSDPTFGRLHLEACVRQTVDLALNLLGGRPLPPIDPRVKSFLADHVRLD
jgi:creatinine amidohydrolase